MEWSIYEMDFKEKSTIKIEWLNNELNKIRTGKINANILDNILIDYYGNQSKIIEVANIKSIDARQLLIKPYENNLTKEIAGAISKANIGVNPIIDADSIRLNFPSLSEETRKDLVKKTKEIAEQAKIGIRNIRKDVHQKINKDEEITKDDNRYYIEMLDKIVKEKNNAIDKIILEKENELMTI